MWRHTNLELGFSGLNGKAKIGMRRPEDHPLS
jgi:hypothetical protein